MKVFTTGMPELYEDVIRQLSPFATFENNFQQVIAMAKSKELEKLCIFMDVWNISGQKFNQMRGQGAAEIIHKIDASVSILIWEGRRFDPPEFEDVPPSFQCSGVICPVKCNNELYLPYDYEDVNEITRKFFVGSLKLEDVPKNEFLLFKFA